MKAQQWQTDSAAMISNDRLAERRAALFRETLVERLERWALGTAWAVHPKRLDNLPALRGCGSRTCCTRSAGCPIPSARSIAPVSPAWSMTLSMPTLLEAYRSGLFTIRPFRSAEMVLACRALRAVFRRIPYRQAASAG